MKNSTILNLAHRGRERILGSTIPIILFFFIMGFGATTALAQPCALVCISNVQVSIDSTDCDAMVTPGVLLQDSSQCDMGQFGVQLRDMNGNPLPTSPMVTMDDLGMIEGVVIDSVSGNSCWSTILVEYKFGPNIACSNDTLDCFETITYTPPVSASGCLDTSEITIRTTYENDSIISCHPEFINLRTVTWLATDQDGRTSECTQEILVTRFDSTRLAFPPNRTQLAGDPLYCDIDYDLDDDGILDWELVGFPTYNGDTLAPGTYPDCNIDVNVEEIRLGSGTCVQKLIRTWKITEWYCASSGSGAVVYEQNQLIDIVDTTGPVITCPTGFEVTTTPGECDAQLILPPAAADGGCSDIIRYDVSIPSASVFLQNQNGGPVTLPVGTHRVIYSARNACLTDTCSMEVTVRDNTPPVAVCDRNTIVSLTNTGTGKAHASTFDDGSHDECGIDRIEVRRMDASCGLDNNFGDYVYFNCCDLDNGPVMVVLRVYDLAGNWNECMVEVEVQDKLAPIISCPPDVTVTCTFPFALDDLSVFGSVVRLDSATQLNDPLLDPRDSIVIDDPADTSYTGPRFIGYDGYALGSCNVSISETVDTSNFNMCGQGSILRRFTATNSSGQSVSCFQRITIYNPDPFGYDDIRWPQQEVVLEGACGGNADPDITGRPEWDLPECGLVGLSGPEDETFTFDDPNDPSCFKILREWTVLDWCAHVPGTDIGRWSFTQVIKVIDTEGPEITSCEDVTICSTDPDCADAAVNVSIMAEDACTDFDGLGFSYVIDLDSDGTRDYTDENNPFANLGNAKNEASGSYPIGVHTIIWEVSDRCGSFTTCSAEIRIDNCTPPKPYCLNGLSAALTPVDRDGDGTNDWGTVDIWASDFDAASEHPCYDTVYLSFSSDTSDRFRTFNCDSIGRNFVELWVTAPNGEQSFCISFIDIQDNNNVCPPGSGTLDMGSIAGRVSTGYDEDVQDVLVNLVGGEVNDMTDDAGHYDFNDMPYGGSYVVEPHKQDDYRNGLTANDLSLIQRHIVGLNPFDADYKHFAADANGDDVLDIRDVYALRRLLLGLDDGLDNVEPWVFYDATCSFISDNPLQEGCDEAYQIPQFNTDMIIDFKAVKVGDVDEDVEIDGLVSSSGRSSRRMTLQTVDQALSAGQQYEVVFTTDELTAIRALQMTLAINPGSATIDDIKSIGLASTAFNMNYSARGMVSMVWAEAEEAQFDTNDELIAVTITALKDGQLSDIIEVTSVVTDAVGFDDAGKIQVGLDFISEKKGHTDGDFALYQNRPNPFADFTTISFTLPKAGDVDLMIADMNGRTVLQRTQHFEAGLNEIRIEKAQLNANGVLYYRVATDAHAATKKMIILE